MKSYAPEFMDNTGQHLEPPSNSRAINAAKVLQENFNYDPLYDEPGMYLVVRTDYNMLTTDAVREYSEHVNKMLHEVTWQECFNVRVNGYYLSQGADWMLSPDNRTTILPIYSIDNTSYIPGFVNYVCNVLADPLQSGVNGSDTLNVEVSGYYVLNAESDGQTAKSMKNMEVIVLPVAFLIIAYFLRRLQLLIIPLTCMGLALGCSFSIGLPIAKRWAVSEDTPETMLSAAVALSIDYSLFLLTRFIDGIDEGMSQWVSIVIMFKNTGQAIVVSALLIGLAFVSSVLMPIVTIASAGALAAITAVVTVVVNLTVVPSFLCLFGKWLVANPFGCCKKKDAKADITIESDEESDVTDDDDDDYESDEQRPLQKGKLARQYRLELQRYRPTFWYKMANFIRNRSTLIIILVLLAGAPIIAQLPKLKISVDRNLSRNRDARSLTVSREVAETGIEMGRIAPSGVAIQSLDPDVKFADQAAFEVISAMNELLYTTFDNTTGDVKRDVAQSAACLMGQKLSYQEALELLEISRSSYPTTRSRLYAQVVDRTIGKDELYAMVVVYTPFRIFGPDGGQWLKDARNLVDEFNVNHKGKYHAVVGAVNGMDMDAADIVESHLPFIIGMICVAVMLIVGGVFRSLLLPIRLAFALAYTIAVTLGFAVLVYQTKAFWWLFPYLKNFEGEGLGYAIPSFVVPVCIALGLDYDIFLLTRVIEYRKAGFSDDESVVMGVASTGSTISGAGLIMSIAFGGMLASTETQLNQFGFLLTVSVLLDTFVIRTVFVPALMLKASRYNWWPRKMPPIVYSSHETTNDIQGSPSDYDYASSEA